ncbi:MAG: GNAT family N-acetyltransferase [Pseudomonadota bacterium]
MRCQRDFSELLKDYPKEVILKDGTGVTLRPLKDGDENALFEMFRRLSADDLWFLNHDVSDPGLIADWIKNLDPNRVISIVALLEGRIVGNAVLMMKRYGAKSHIGKVRISVDPGFRDRRLGTWMLLDLVNLSMAMGLQMLVMRLVQDRDASLINGVRKLGFIKEAVLKNYLMGGEGQAHNLVIMTKRLPVECYDS